MSRQILTGVALLCFFRSGLCAFAEPYWNSTEFDDGKYGLYELQEYGSFRLPSPRLNIIHWDPQCEYGYTLLTPRGASVQQPGPMIIDGRGNLIWTDDKWGKTANMKIQTYKGEEFLTFWAGEVEETYGKGSYYMIDSSYEVRYNLKPDGEFEGDLHEFSITPDGTALISIYHTIEWPLQDMGVYSPKGYIVDNIFQEIDIETGTKLFEWRASDHFPVRDTLTKILTFGRSANKPFDFFHLNSITKDEDGNYWISSRHFCAVYCISSSDGSILHTLGGHNTNFRDLSGGAATNFTWQHHMSWHFPETDSYFSTPQDSKYITIFDNAANTQHPPEIIASRALVIRLDMSDASQPTAELLKSYTSPMFLQTISQGSMEILPPLSAFESVPHSSSKEQELESNLAQSVNETVFVGWGQAYAYTLYDAPTGRVLCDVHMGAYKHFQTGYVKSYRSYRRLQPWIGKPNSRPSIGLWKHDTTSPDPPDRKIYASWNGATEVRGWILQGSNEFLGAENENDVPGWANIAASPKEGFEVAFDLNSHPANDQARPEPPFAYKYYRVHALATFYELVDQADSFESMGVTGTLDFENRVVIHSVDPESEQRGELKSITDKDGQSQEYLVASAIHTPHKKPTLAAFDAAISSTPVVISVIIFCGLVLGTVVIGVQWLEARGKRNHRRHGSEKIEKQGLLDKID